MKYFLYAVSKRAIFCVAFLFCGLMVDAMDGMERPDDPQEVKLLKKVKIWDNERAVATGQRWKNVVPGDITMTPDETGALISWFGRVDYVNFKTMQQSEPYPLNRHNHKKYYPLVAAAMKKNTLKVISVMNNGQGAECIISSNKISHNPDCKSHNIFEKNVYRVVPLRGLVQSVALRDDGNFAVIGYKKSLEVIDLKKKHRYESNFMPYDQGAFIVAVSKPVSMNFNSEEQEGIAAANSKGVIDLKTIGEDDSKDYGFRQVKDVKTGATITTIKEIRCNSKELLCVTSDNKIAIINISDLIEHSHDSIKYRTIEGCHSCKVAIGNNFSDKNLSTIHWRGDASKSEDVRFKVEVRRENGTSFTFSIFSLLDHVSKTYCQINDKGQSEEMPSHVLECRVGDNHAMVLPTDGYLYFFQLPKQYKSPTEDDIINFNQAQQYGDRITRRRSSSSPVPPFVGEKHKNEKRKSGDKSSGSRLLGSLIGSSGSKEVVRPTPSRDKNTRSKEASKQTTPSRDKNTINKEVSKQTSPGRSKTRSNTISEPIPQEGADFSDALTADIIQDCMAILENMNNSNT